MVQNKFASDDPYILPALSATARTNQADLQVIVRETDHLKATSAYFQNQGLTNNPANPVSNATLVAQGTVGNAVGDGEIIDPNTCPEINQWVRVRDDLVWVPKQVKDLTLDDWLWNPFTQEFEQLVCADIIENSVIWGVHTTNGIHSYGSPSHPLMEGTWDNKGTALEKVRLNMNTWSVVSGDTAYTRVSKIFKRRTKGTVRHLETAGPGHIYCAGSTPNKMLAFHNLKPNPDR